MWTTYSVQCVYTNTYIYSGIYIYPYWSWLLMHSNYLDVQLIVVHELSLCQHLNNWILLQVCCIILHQFMQGRTSLSKHKCCWTLHDTVRYDIDVLFLSHHVWVSLLFAWILNYWQLSRFCRIPGNLSYLKTASSLLQVLVWVHVNGSNEKCAWFFICTPSVCPLMQPL